VLVLLMEGIHESTVEMKSGGMTHTPCVMETGTDVEAKLRFCLRNL
jgi:hypothetical protein